MEKEKTIIKDNIKQNVNMQQLSHEQFVAVFGGTPSLKGVLQTAQIMTPEGGTAAWTLSINTTWWFNGDYGMLPVDTGSSVESAYQIAEVCGGSYIDYYM